MEGLVNLIESISQSKREYIPKLTNALTEHQSFRYKNPNVIDSIISRINLLLNNISTRYEGLLLLKAFLPQCPLDSLEQIGGHWITSCTRTCSQKKSFDDSSIVTLAFDLLGEIIPKSINIPDLGKKISNNLLINIIDCCTIHTETYYLDSLKCLEICLRNYPGCSGTSRQNIQAHIYRSIDSTNEIEILQAAKCQHLLQQIRGGGVQGVSHKNAWITYQLQLLGTLHEYFDLLFSNTSEIFDVPNITERLIVPTLNVSAEPIEKAVQILTRCNNLCKFLETMLIEPFPVSKSIYPIKILGLISRGLSVNCTTLSKNLITDNVAVGALIPELHVNLLKILNTLIIVLKSNMLLYGKSICKIFVQSLNWTNSGISKGQPKPFSSIRSETYNTISLWCKVTKYGSTIEDTSEQIISHILQDITPYQSEVTLKVLAGSNKSMSKKAKKKLHNKLNETSHMTQTHSNAINQQNGKHNYSDSGNEIVCAKALECLVGILESCGCFLKPSLQKLLQEKIVSLAFTVVEAKQKQLKTNLYTVTECRKNLYAALHALVTCSHHLCPPPLQYAINIFTIAQMFDINSSVRNVCSKYHCSLERILHPQKNILHFSIDTNEVRDALLKEKLTDVNLNIDENDSDSEVEIEVFSLNNGGLKPVQSPNKIIECEEKEEVIGTKEIIQLNQTDKENEKQNGNEIESENQNGNEIESENQNVNTDDDDIETISNHEENNFSSDTDNDKKEEDKNQVEIEHETGNKIDEHEITSKISITYNGNDVKKNGSASKREMETINLDSASSDDDIQCEDEPIPKRKKHEDIENLSSTDILDAMEASFVSELNEEIVIE